MCQPARPGCINSKILRPGAQLAHDDVADAPCLVCVRVCNAPLQDGLVDLVDHLASAEGTAGFLEALAHLTKLTVLQLEAVPLAALDQQHSQRFSALTASSRLVDLSFCGTDELPLPKHVVQHMLRVPLMSLTSLTRLCVCAVSKDFEPLALPEYQPVEDLWCLDAADVDAIAACCPVLKSLDLRPTMRCSPEALHSLLHLQQTLALPELSVGGPCFDDDAGPILGRMTSLEDLRINDAPDCTAVGLQHLTALHQLTSFKGWRCGFCRPPLVEDGEFDININHWPAFTGGQVRALLLTMFRTTFGVTRVASTHTLLSLRVPWYIPCMGCGGCFEQRHKHSVVLV